MVLLIKSLSVMQQGQKTERWESWQGQTFAVPLRKCCHWHDCFFKLLVDVACYVKIFVLLHCYINLWLVKHSSVNISGPFNLHHAYTDMINCLVFWYASLFLSLFMQSSTGISFCFIVLPEIVRKGCELRKPFWLISTQPTNTYSKLTIGTLKQGVKYVQICQ